MSTDTFLAEVRRLEAAGSRLTGSESHRALVAHVAAQLAELGLEVQHDRHTFTRWDAPRARERLSLNVDGADVEISAAFPYSGTTGVAGVSGRLQLIRGLRKNWSTARGALAVIEVPHCALPWDVLVGAWDRQPRHKPFLNPVVSAALFGPKLDAARKAGVVGVVAVWRGMSTACAARQYVPFTEPYHDLPAVWVVGHSAERILAAARAGSHARLVLDAVLTPGCTTETVWALSPGASANETILVVTHSDGTNAVEENGHIALLELARDAVERPHQRAIVYVYTTGHLRIPAVTQHGQATSAWLNAHRDLWAGGRGQARALAGLAMEHFGAREFRDDSVRETYAPTGRPEPELLYATTRQLRDLALEEWSGADPDGPRIWAPGPLIHFGEGEPLFQRRIPAIALCTGPQHLLAERDDDFVDIDILRRQVESFRRLQRRLDAAPALSLGVVKAPSQWRRLIAIMRVALVALRATRGRVRPSSATESRREAVDGQLRAIHIRPLSCDEDRSTPICEQSGRERIKNLPLLS